MASGNEKSHWVQDVFPAKFSLSSEDLNRRVESIGDQTSENGQLGAKSNTSVYEMVARRLSPLDVTGIKNAYERVWLMAALEEEEKKRRAQLHNQTKNVKEQPESIGASIAKDKETQSNITRGIGGLQVDQTVDECVDTEDSRLWDSDEIEVLRKVFKATKSKNNYLKSLVYTTNEHLKQMEQKCKKQHSSLEVKSHRLQETQKTNERLQIMCNNLKKELQNANKTIEFLHREINELRLTQAESTKEVHNVRLDLDKERIDRQHAQFDLESQQQSALVEMQLREEKLKRLHEEDINYLQNQIDELTKDLEKERLDHQRSLKGLQHLRNHFSSVPLLEANEVKNKANVVKENQLKQWIL